MRRLTLLLLGAMIVAGVLSALPTPAFALGPPTTLASSRALGDLAGSSGVVDPSFDVDYLGVSWTAGAKPSVRFLIDGRWTRWSSTETDDIPTSGGRTFSALVPAGGADAYQVRGTNRGVRAVAINATEGPRSLTVASAEAGASVAQSPVVSRAQWGADESYRFNADGSEKWPPAFYATKMLIVHHTDTDDQGAATVRAIYRYHAIDRGWGDIGYNFLVDGRGNIYKGRYSGPPGTWYEDTPTGEDALGRGVTAAHTSGWNSGTMGIAVLGNYTTASIPAAARSALVDHLAWEADHHGIDPQARSTYTNPVSGAQKTTANISGHRDWVATDCPGDTLYAALPSIRDDVAARIAASAPAPQTVSYAPDSTVLSKGTTSDSVAALASDDGTVYRVASARQGKKQAVDWYGWAQVQAAGMTALTFTYDGSATRSVTQTLYVYDFAAGAWRLTSSSTVSTADQTLTWSTTSPGPYVSPAGEVRLRVASTAGQSFTSNADLMRFTVQY